MAEEQDSHIDMAQVRGRAELAHAIVGDGPVVMLNLLRFRAVADYSKSPELAPQTPISGEAAYELYIAALAPRMKRRGNEILFWGKSGPFLIGAETERWDRVLMVRWPNLGMILGNDTDAEYQAAVGHRTAALEDSRLLPILQLP